MPTAALFITPKQEPAGALPTREHFLQLPGFTEAGQLLRSPGLTGAWTKWRPSHRELQLMGKSNIKLIKETGFKVQKESHVKVATVALQSSK